TARRRTCFSRSWSKFACATSFVVAGYVMMPEHIHLLISEPESWNSLHGHASAQAAFAHRVLSEWRRESSGQRLWQEAVEAGHVWQRRFYDFVVWTEAKKIEKLKYIHRNLVERGLVLEPDQWAWSRF